MIVIVIDRILSRKPFGVIFAGRVTEGGPTGLKRLVVLAKREVLFGSPAVGESWRVEGSLRHGPNGPQIDATQATRVLPSGILIRDYIAREISGIGADRADRLWKAYGLDLPEVLLAGDIPAIADVMAPERPILGPRLAASLVRAWREADAETRLVAWAQKRGVDDARLVRRIAKIFGRDAIDHLERNPWRLVPFLPWKKVDGLGLRVAREDGIAEPEDDLNRLIGAVDAAVKDLIETGATAITDRDLRARVAGKLNVPRGHRRLDAAMSAGVRNRAIISGQDGIWRAPGCAMMEDAILTHLRRMLVGTPVHHRDGPPVDLETALIRYERSIGPLHPEQRAAVLKVLRNPFSCLQGGAGVGKTHTTKAICAVWESVGGKVLLAALAGKAALRLSKSTGRLARTLFRTIAELDERATVLERRSSPEMDPGEYAALDSRLACLPEVTPKTLVLIDEASMVDVPSLHALLRRMPNGARLLMVGDDRQLPPVSFGLTFHQVVSDPGITTRLTVVHRQAGETGIPRFSAALRNRTMPALPCYTGTPQDGVFLLAASSAEEIANGVVKVVGELTPDEVMVLAPTNEGPAGVRSLNKRLHDLHLRANGGSEVLNPLGEFFSVGEPIVHRRNDYRRGLFNGSLGIVKSIDLSTNSLTAIFDGDEGEHLFDGTETIDLSLAYALTCHRAQGSQAKRIVVALSPSRLLDPSWLYTAVTRAENQVVIVGGVDTIADALKIPWAAERRQVGLRWLEGV